MLKTDSFSYSAPPGGQFMQWTKILFLFPIAKIVKTQLLRSFQATICDEKKKNVWCCENTKGESVQPEFKDIEDLNNQYCSSDKNNQTNKVRLNLETKYGSVLIFRIP